MVSPLTFMTRKLQLTSMKKNKTATIILILLGYLLPVCAQETQYRLSKNEFLSIVREYHPIAISADVRVQITDADITKARGAFDPKIKTDFERKTFDNKLYYSYLNPQISIPTWYGIDFKAGAEEVIGSRVNNEATLGQTTYAGLSVQLNSLLFDQRRATLRQAQTIKQMTIAERENAINDLMFQSIEAYWQWVNSYQALMLLENITANAEKRYKFVVTQYRQGSRAAIDTTEILAQLQTFYVQKNEAYVTFQNSGLLLSTYMWLEDGTPMSWSEAILPDSVSVSEIPDRELPPLISYTNKIDEHPKIRSLSHKVDALTIDKKLKAQYLIPKLNVSTNVLGKGYSIPSADGGSFLTNNHKVGLNFSLPIFQRSARGAYQAASLKIREKNLEKTLAARHIDNKITSYYNEVLALQKQVAIYADAYSNYTKLYRGEQTKFNIGESSVFLLNSRETKLLSASLKLVELKTKLQIKYAGLHWAAGFLQ